MPVTHKLHRLGKRSQLHGAAGSGLRRMPPPPFASSWADFRLELGDQDDPGRTAIAVSHQRWICRDLQRTGQRPGPIRMPYGALVEGTFCDRPDPYPAVLLVYKGRTDEGGFSPPRFIQHPLTLGMASFVEHRLFGYAIHNDTEIDQIIGASLNTNLARSRYFGPNFFSLPIDTALLAIVFCQLATYREISSEDGKVTRFLVYYVVSTSVLSTALDFVWSYNIVSRRASVKHALD